MLGNIFITAGLFLLAIGLLLMIGQGLGWSHLPGDIVVRKGNFTFYFPLATSILLSIILTLIFYLINKK